MAGASTFGTVFVAGSGFMGSAIAFLVASKTSASVQIYDISDAQLAKAEATIEKFGKSLEHIKVLPNSSPNFLTFSKVSSVVSQPGISSTSFITWAGEKKCIPINWLERFVAAARLVIERDEVLEAKIASFLQILSRRLNKSFFSSKSSAIASMTISLWAANFSDLVE